MQKKDRRKALKSIVLSGAGTTVVTSQLGSNWVKPIVESVVLPSHAATSIPIIMPDTTSAPMMTQCAVGSNSISQGLAGTDPARNGQLRLTGLNRLSGRSIAARNEDSSICDSGLSVRFSVIQNGVEFISDQTPIQCGPQNPCVSCVQILGANFSFYSTTTSGPEYIPQNSMASLALGSATFVANWSDGATCSTTLQIVEDFR